MEIECHYGDEIVEMPFGRLHMGFFRRAGSEQIFFAQPHGRWSFPFPVVNGKIRNHSEEVLSPMEKVEVIPISRMREFGMDIKLGDDPQDKRFWS